MSSRIYHSLDLKRLRVDDVNLARNPMGSPNPDRPRGGIIGLTSQGMASPPMSDIERNERLARQKVEEAERLLQSARQKVEDAEHQAEVIQRDAYHAGFEHGEKAGAKLGEQKVDSAIQNLASLMEAIRAERERIARLHEQDLIKIAFAIASEVLKTHIEMEPEVLGGVVEAALAKVTKVHQIKLTVSASDGQLIERMIQQSKPQCLRDASFELVADEKLPRGSCLLETDTGSIDCSVLDSIQTLHDVLWNT